MSVIVDKVGYNVVALFFSSLLLVAPLLSGIGIASLGNDEYIKRCFFKLHYLNKSMNHSNVTGKMFPAKVWSMGFVFPVGGWIGSLVAAFTVEKYGRKFPSIGFCLCAITGSTLKFLSRYWHVALLFVGRLFDGISSAGLMVSAVLLLFETIPLSAERTFKPLIQIFVNLGILIISCSSLYSIVDVNWNFPQLISAVLAVILAIGLFFNKESPKYIHNRYKNLAKTEKVLRSLRGKHFHPKELEDLKFLTTKRFLLATLTLLVLQMGQQLSGINAIVAFAPSLLQNAGFDKPDIGAMIIVLFAVVGSIIFAPFVARLKRKFLWILGFCSMSLSFILFVILQELSVFFNFNRLILSPG
ncbi:Solute carrier family 2, facilitated glucose transporter member 7 [Thelohanellus kitauei]|uniref:Solute carrier family 2, facilitated glucose transporter member 7 n=1 Tax=Thelohanellus kitauei TaxID=669202 RepID=A0A0C2IZ53_THEKT|nr:Solute carrier family 2, facilitated glucose transporter member 7 [Thelohanellus kitauei]